jgi:hypothetical protein
MLVRLSREPKLPSPQTEVSRAHFVVHHRDYRRNWKSRDDDLCALLRRHGLPGWARRWPRRPVPLEPAQISAEQLVIAEVLAMTLAWRRAGGLR